MDNVFSSSVAAGLAAASETVGERMGSPVSFALAEPVVVGPDAVARFPGGAIAAWTRLAGDPGIHVGLVFEDEALFTLAALKLRLGVFPEEMTEDVVQALNELVASFIEGWNGAQRLPRMGWDELAPVRAVATADRAALDAQLNDRPVSPVGMIGATLSLGSSVFNVGVVGSLGWMPAATRVVAPGPASRPASIAAARPAESSPGGAAEPAAPAPIGGDDVDASEASSPPPTPPPPPRASEASERGPGAPGAPPAHGDDERLAAASPPPASRVNGDESLGVAFPTPPPPPFALPESATPPPQRGRPDAERPRAERSEGGRARVMIVDASGALSAWLSRQLASRSVALYHADAASIAASEGATVLIVDADAALFAQLEPERMVVMRRG